MSIIAKAPGVVTTHKAEWQPLNVLRDKLTAARCRLLTKEPWYGHIATTMEWTHSYFPWQQDEKSKTMGVRIMSNGMIQCIWYPGFVHDQSLEQLYATIYHEIEHIVRVHCLRIGTERNPEAWNIACDCCINGKRSDPKIGYKDPLTNKVILPLDGNIIFVPEDWESGCTAEKYYNMLIKTTPTKGKGSGGNVSVDGGYQYGPVSGRQVDDHSVWQQSEVSQDEARQMVKDLTDQATIKCQGNSPSHLSEVLKELGKPIVRWRELLRRFIGVHVGNQRRTFSRRNRRHDFFGTPGISHHAAATVNVIIDTSGSIGSKELEQFFAEIDMISSKARVSVLQWDAAFQGYDKYRRGMWRKFKIKGRGGTDMQAPIRFLQENNLLRDCQIMLTDGYCSYVDKPGWFPGLGMITVITTPKDVGAEPNWGHVIRMKLS